MISIRRMLTPRWASQFYEMVFIFFFFCKILKLYFCQPNGKWKLFTSYPSSWNYHRATGTQVNNLKTSQNRNSSYLATVCGGSNSEKYSMVNKVCTTIWPRWWLHTNTSCTPKIISKTSGTCMLYNCTRT